MVTPCACQSSTRTCRILLRVPRRQADRVVQAVDVERVLPPQLPDGRQPRQRAVAPRRGGVQRLHVDVREERLQFGFTAAVRACCRSSLPEQARLLVATVPSQIGPVSLVKDWRYGQVYGQGQGWG